MSITIFSLSGRGVSSHPCHPPVSAPVIFDLRQVMKMMQVVNWSKPSWLQLEVDFDNVVDVGLQLTREHQRDRKLTLDHHIKHNSRDPAVT